MSPIMKGLFAAIVAFAAGAADAQDAKPAFDESNRLPDKPGMTTLLDRAGI